MSPAQREIKRLQALSPAESAFALGDLYRTPGALFSAKFVGELFYGRTPGECLAKAAEFAADCGPDMVATLAAEGAAVHPLPTE